MKRILCLILSICLILGNLGTFGVLAADSPSLTVSCEQQCSAGEQITVSVDLSGVTADSAYCGLSFGLIYDNSKFAYASHTAGPIISGLGNVNPEAGGNEIYVNYMIMSPKSDNGKVVEIVFDVLDTAEGEAEFNLVNTKLKSVSYQNIPVNVVDAATEIIPPVIPTATVAIVCDSRCNAGGQLTVSVNLSDITEELAYCGLSFGLLYDNTRFSYASYTAGPLMQGLATVNPQAGDSEIYVNYMVTTPVTDNGNVIDIVFDVLDAAEGEAEFALVDVRLKSVSYQNHPVETVGAITAVNPLPAPVAKIVADRTVSAGETVAVEVVLENAVNYCGLSFGLHYDHTKFSYVDHAVGSVLSGMAIVNPAAEENEIYVNDGSVTPVSKNGTVVTVVFRAREYITDTGDFSLYDFKLKNVSYENIPAQTVDGTVAIVCTHQNVAWNELKAPTCGEKGLKELTCPCGHYATEEIDTIPHSNTVTSYVPNGDETHTTVIVCLTCEQMISGVADNCADENHDLACDVCGGDVNKLASGVCGDDLTWTLDKDGLLTISGTGEMYSYPTTSSQTMPWYSDYRNVIKAVVIQEGATSIGIRAFCDCVNLETVEIPDSVTSIGGEAFRACKSLKTFEVGANVTSLIGTTFFGCTGLTEINVSPDNTKYASVDGVFFNKNMTSLNAYPAGKVGEYTIPDGVTSIYTSAFAHCEGLTSVTIPDSVANINLWAFIGCTNLTDVYFLGDAPAYITANSFEKDLVTLYCLPGTTGWTDSNAYDAAAGTWNGYKLVVEEVEAPEVTGTITHAARTLSLDGAIIINQYLYIDGFEGIDLEENGGVLFFKEAVSAEEATVENPKAINQAGLTYDAEKNRYGQCSHGIAAKEYGDTIYIRGYVMDNNGNYHYGELMEYGVRAYCEGRLEKSSDQLLKNICVSLLHYGAAAQEYFDYNLNNLANSGISAKYPNFAWDEALLDDVAAATTNIPASANVAVTNKSLSLEGAIIINFYSKVYNVTAEKVELLLWRGVTGELTLDNVTEVKTTVYDASKGRYDGESMGIFAKNYGQTVFACAKVTDTGGNVHYSEIIGYSPEAYAKSRLEKSSDEELKNVVKTMTIYGDRAARYFYD